MDMSLGKLQETMENRESWRAAVHGVQSRTRLSGWTTSNNFKLFWDQDWTWGWFPSKSNSSSQKSSSMRVLWRQWPYTLAHVSQKHVLNSRSEWILTHWVPVTGRVPSNTQHSICEIQTTSEYQKLLIVVKPFLCNACSFFLTQAFCGGKGLGPQWFHWLQRAVFLCPLVASWQILRPSTLFLVYSYCFYHCSWKKIFLILLQPRRFPQVKWMKGDFTGNCLQSEASC